MRHLRMVAALAVALTLVGFWRPVAAQGTVASVNILDFKFDPATLAVKNGTSVTWTNNGAAAHTVTASDGSWDSGNLDPGATFSKTFSTDGSVAYYCKYHGSATGTGMAASLTVAQADQPTAAPTTPPSGPTPSISASDQPIVNKMITVSKVVAAQDGWIAVHKNGPDGKLLVSPIVGLAAVKAGTWENVKVELSEAFKAGDTLYPMLHIDAGNMGTYEFPGPDSPVQVDGNVILASFKVTEAPATVTPSISASDQPIVNKMITVSKVVAAQDGWIAVHKNGPDGKLLVAPIVGLLAVKAGTWENVKVELTEAFKAGDTLYPMLHIDAGTMGTYEFPGPDSPVQVDGNIILASFKVTEAPATVTPSISASDQPIVNKMITVSKVVAAQDGWIAVHKNGPDGKLLVSPIVGLLAVKAGTWENVKVELTEAFKAGDTLYPMLHIDAGTMGTYEFPGPDSPVQVDGNIILASFKVTGGTPIPPTLPDTGGASLPTSVLIIGALALLGLGFALAHRRRTA